MIVGLSPMDGVTDCAYRIICKKLFEKHGASKDKLMLRTEFMSAEGYVHNPQGVIKHLLTTDYEPELIAQIFGGNPESLIYCAQDIEKHYSFGGIELNMGCPSPKIMKCDSGSGMLKNKKRTLGIIKKISSSLTTPFSLKTRVGLTSDDLEEQFDFLIEASKYVWMIGLHGRTYKQSHSGEVNREFIYRLKKHCPNTIIIGNGGIRSYEQAKERIGILDGTMIGQSAIGNPRVLLPHEPTIQERFETIFAHLDLAMAQEQYFTERSLSSQAKQGILIMPTFQELENRASTINKNPEHYNGFYTPREFRKYLFNYISGLPGNKIIKKNIPQAREYNQLKIVLESFLNDLIANGANKSH